MPVRHVQTCPANAKLEAPADMPEADVPTKWREHGQLRWKQGQQLSPKHFGGFTSTIQAYNHSIAFMSSIGTHICWCWRLGGCGNTVRQAWVWEHCHITCWRQEKCSEAWSWRSDLEISQTSNLSLSQAVWLCLTCKSKPAKINKHLSRALSQTYAKSLT